MNRSAQLSNLSPGKAAAAPQYEANSVSWFFQYPGEHGTPGGGGGGGGVQVSAVGSKMLGSGQTQVPLPSPESTQGDGRSHTSGGGGGGGGVPGFGLKFVPPTADAAATPVGAVGDIDEDGPEHAATTASAAASEKAVSNCRVE